MPCADQTRLRQLINIHIRTYVHLYIHTSPSTGLWDKGIISALMEESGRKWGKNDVIDNHNFHSVVLNGHL